MRRERAVVAAKVGRQGHRSRATRASRGLSCLAVASMLVAASALLDLSLPNFAVGVSTASSSVASTSMRTPAALAQGLRLGSGRIADRPEVTRRANGFEYWLEDNLYPFTVFSGFAGLATGVFLVRILEEASIVSVERGNVSENMQANLMRVEGGVEDVDAPADTDKLKATIAAMAKTKAGKDVKVEAVEEMAIFKEEDDGW